MASPSERATVVGYETMATVANSSNTVGRGWAGLQFAARRQQPGTAAAHPPAGDNRAWGDPSCGDPESDIAILAGCHRRSQYHASAYIYSNSTRPGGDDHPARQRGAGAYRHAALQRPIAHARSDDACPPHLQWASWLELSPAVAGGSGQGDCQCYAIG